MRGEQLGGPLGLGHRLLRLRAYIHGPVTVTLLDYVIDRVCGTPSLITKQQNKNKQESPSLAAQEHTNKREGRVPPLPCFMAT